MNDINLNLARKWRSKNFDGIIGQELSIRILKNSLYVDHYFPVYLFSGQRGCGKTSTARVFACALNCRELAQFQKDPKISIPCLSCDSCQALMHGKHPDFIEIDAASHTGVDNVRQIIDAAALLPLLGRKKIYLIDEAHMLSKAAFNALLKILEEPPLSVIFILATTDPQKILDTVMSRCFKIYFKAVTIDDMVSHLEHICKQENIEYEIEGLMMIVNHAEGSIRDALNLLEQVRFSSSIVSKKMVFTVLGRLDDERLIELFNYVINGSIGSVLKFLQEIGFESFSAAALWYSCIELIRAALWCHYELKPKHFQEFHEQIKILSKQCSPSLLNSYLQVFYDNELVFLKTTAQHRLFEMVLLQLCQQADQKPMPSSSQNVPTQDKAPIQEIKREQVISSEVALDSIIDDRWNLFLTKVETLKDPLLMSIFKQGKFLMFEQESGRLDIGFSKEFSFFQEWLENTETLWQPLLRELFTDTVRFNPLFSEAPTENVVEQKIIQKNNQAPVSDSKKSFTAPPTHHTKVNQNQEKKLDISDEEVWKKTHELLRVFPGTIREIIKDTNE